MNLKKIRKALLILLLLQICFYNEGKAGVNHVFPVYFFKSKPLIFADFFSPNKDGHNDFFVIQNIEEHPINKLFVFNRWGDLVYTAEPYKNDWDGVANVENTFIGNELPEGVYFYRLEYLLGDFVSKASGKVILKR